MGIFRSLLLTVLRIIGTEPKQDLQRRESAFEVSEIFTRPKHDKSTLSCSPNHSTVFNQPCPNLPFRTHRDPTYRFIAWLVHRPDENKLIFAREADLEEFRQRYPEVKIVQYHLIPAIYDSGDRFIWIFPVTGEGEEGRVLYESAMLTVKAAQDQWVCLTDTKIGTRLGGFVLNPGYSMSIRSDLEGEPAWPKYPEEFLLEALDNDWELVSLYAGGEPVSDDADEDLMVWVS